MVEDSYSRSWKKSETQWVRTASTPTVPFEPVSLDEAREQCNVKGNESFDSLLTRLIQSARETVELDTGIVCATGTFTRKFSQWPGSQKLELRGIRPVSSATSIVYTATDGTSTTFAGSNYTLDGSAVVPVVNLTWNTFWPP